MIVGIILSAGESKRMGTPKQLLPWGNTTMLQQVIQNAEASRLGRVVVVLGHRADEIAARVPVSSKTRIVVNPDFRTGMSSSIKSGIRSAPADAEAFMLLLGDQPFIGAAVIDKLIDVYHSGKGGIVIPVCNGRRGHPVILDLRYGEELLSIHDQGAREVIHRHSSDVFEVPVDSSGILSDIDTPQDYREAMKQAFEKK
ncbi:MAG: Molybdenum cofactor cytidylyltransferase [Syntrophaceae bacterium PtaU1.Bin231]|nr:MAG: Molybdenum cofactor cytidylyltransferase [Syntrophaceae bacterium PtaU1.Bin231]